jgi:hypothetical protein
MTFARDLTRTDDYYTGLSKLREAVRLREALATDRYWYQADEDCTKLAKKLLLLENSDRQEIAQVLGKENFA